jgi:AraC-like DNA-binding protein
VRIAYAARSIATSRARTLSEIALDHGYYDHSHLAHEFRAQTGITPLEWKAQALGA